MEINLIIGADEHDRGEEIIAKRTSIKRQYWKHMDRIIGASSGQETSYVYVEYHMSGHVHGRPITEGELRKKGVKL